MLGKEMNIALSVGFYALLLIVGIVLGFVVNHFKPMSWLNSKARKFWAVTVLTVALIAIFSTQTVIMNVMSQGNLSLALNDGAIIQRCHEFTINGSTEEGREVWLIHQAKKAETYFLQPARQVSPDKNQWHTLNTVGSENDGGVEFDFQAISVDREWANWLRSMRDPADSINVLNKHNEYAATQIPPSIHKSPVVSGTRIKGASAAC
ncbi:hypothetical protein [Spirillospora sp. CA-294931]|uniref:hypothetical protein n=1 Tax=Spirillospora sp. CA-294931 TaxID=3240042 RepID=UPI003D8F1BF2